MKIRSIILLAVAIILAIMVFTDNKYGKKKPSNPMDLKKTREIYAVSSGKLNLVHENVKKMSAFSKLYKYHNGNSPKGQLQFEINKLLKAEGLIQLQAMTGNETRKEKMSFMSRVNIPVSGKIDQNQFQKWLEIIVKLESTFPTSHWQNLQISSKTDSLHINGTLLIDILNNEYEQVLNEIER